MIRPTVGLGLLLVALALWPARAAAQQLSQQPRVSDMRVLLDLKTDHLQVIEVFVIDPAAGAGAAKVRLPIPTGVNPDHVSASPNLTRDGNVFVATPSGGPLRVELRYAISSATGTFTYRRQLGVPIVRMMGVAPEGGFDCEVGSGLQLARNVTERDGRSLGGDAFAWIDGAGLRPGHPIEISLTHAAARNPVRDLYLAVVALVICGFALLQVGLVLDYRARRDQSAQTRAYLEQQLAALDAAVAKDEVTSDYADVQRKQLQRLLEDK